MIVKDIMAPFELYQPTTLKDAFSVLDSYGKDAWKMAGGYDSLDWFKDRIVRPKAVVDLTGIDEMKGVKETPDGVEIGALTTLTDIENNDIIKSKYRLLAEAVSHVASPQIRNHGTIGGNASQNARCLYFRYGLPCYRAGGTTCFADTPEGVNREHALFGADRCIAVSSSDGSPALAALDAQFVIQSSGGQRVVKSEDFFVGPAVDITRLTATKPEEILTAIRLPKTWANANFYFEKVTDRNAWDFPLVNVAAAIQVANGVISDSRIVVGGVSAVPHRLNGVESIIKGKPLGADIATVAGQSSTRDARPVNYNGFKIPLMANLVTRAVREAKA
ncbi:MAG TPA: xanthine dehydrogenase family protein subunit M [Rhizomicrobium sp.]|nr:xanthine dehydrogenase family protein subunit M [Rhizomicrobium sp.]